VNLPPPGQQRAIADVLSTFDDKIELNRRMNQTLESMARAFFRSWFVDFDPVVAKAEGRQPFGMSAEVAGLFPSEFRESELGVIPKGWTVESIGDRASKIQYGYTQSASKLPVGPKFLRITDIQGGRVDWGAVPYCECSKKDFETYRICAGDILVARTGASTGENIYVAGAPVAVFASYLVRVQFANRGVARVVGQFMRSEEYFNYIEGSIGGSAQPNAGAPVLTGARLAYPPADTAEAFQRLVESFDLQRLRNMAESVTLAALRDTLLPKLMSGELRVRDAERLVGAHV
jgi:type I restriction enzyme S subunit